MVLFEAFKMSTLSKLVPFSTAILLNMSVLQMLFELAPLKCEI